MANREGDNGRIYHAAIYVRLSKEDKEKVESDSIVNQKALIKNYLADKRDIVVCMECVDDGFSGVDFERPSFKRMIGEIENGNIDCVIVKDLSRFGRNFVETGRYLDQIFPALGVRFIAVNDGFDSVDGRNFSDRILIPFKNLINDAYCRDISIKIRSQLEIKRKKGDFIGSFAIYGYQRDPDDRHHLVVDEYAAAVVREIFKWKLEGASQQRIADRLNQRGELSPMEYKRFCGLRYQSGFQLYTKTKWTAVTVGRMLQNEYYIGTLVQGKCTTPNHKVKKIVQRPSKEWVRVENSHEPVVDREIFYAVNNLLLQDMRVAPKEKVVYPLSGLLFCADCHSNMVRSSVCRNGKTYTYYMCGNNRANKICSSHRVQSAMLEKVVWLVVREQTGSLDMEQISWEMEDFSSRQRERRRVEAQRERKQKEIERYDRLKQSLYKSMLDGLLEREEYMELKAGYEKRIQEIKAQEEKDKERVEGLLKYDSDKKRRAKEILRQNLLEINRYIAILLIERIEVYEKYRIALSFRYSDRIGDRYGAN